MTKAGIWKNPQLRRLILAGIPADFADWLDYVAIALGLPYLIIGPFAGALIDKSDLRIVLIASNLGRAATTAALIFAPNVVILLTLVFVRGAIDSAFTPARQTAIQTLADGEQRNSVNSIVHGINQLSKVAGPALGGLLLVWFAPQTVFTINAFISLLAAINNLGDRYPAQTIRCCFE